MNPSCFVCSSQVTRVCVHDQCSSPPLFCSGQCQQGLSQRLHMHNKCLNTISYQEYQTKISQIRDKLDPKIFYQQNLDNIKKEVLRTKNAVIEELDQAFFKLQKCFFIQLKMELKKKPQEILDLVEADFQGKNLKGKYLYELLKNQDQFIKEEQRLAKMNLIRAIFQKDLEKIKKTSIQIHFVECKEAVEKSKALFYEGQNHFLDYKWQQALQKYEQAKQINAYDSKIYYQIGNCLRQTQKINQAIQSYEMSLELGQCDFKIFYYLGLCYDKKGNYQQALKCYIKSQGGDNYNFSILSKIGDCYFRLEIYKESKLAYQRALKFRPYETIIMHKLAQIERKTQKQVKNPSIMEKIAKLWKQTL